MTHKTQLIHAAGALPGRTAPLAISGRHFVSGQPMLPPFPAHLAQVYFAMGCFWGVERLFWQQPGVRVTAVGYQGGFTPNPSYEEVCSGLTGHAESVLVVFDPRQIDFATLLKLFWEQHDPAQGMAQGADIGTQYRSAIFTTSAAQQAAAEASRAAYAQAMAAAGDARPITTEINPAPAFYFAEEYHQQYLAKHPGGYCGLGGIGVCLPPQG
ncbi:peptide-methionine (S)-S-oxide reductase MsrA [Pseudaeromonas sp. ZJS20]|uniref:peptide-methionine (S)-S-oxide reductase MsrA n=1 Tax=Pseudaeromonas aegiceratis TaxID=3153928 RepID=UPI00390C59D1